MGLEPVLARAALHFDEEPVISQNGGSGAVFFSGCSLRCCFCQNYEVSHHDFGLRVSVARLREIFFELKDQGARNINLVNPTHFSQAIAAALEDGFPLPVIWNSGGYDSVETLKLLEGKISVFLPDYKYSSGETARRYSGAGDYPQVAQAALKEMARQAGPVELDENGNIVRGLIVRHLILPGKVEESMAALDWIAEELPDAWVSLMAQYLPFGAVEGVDELNRRLREDEYERVCDHLLDLGLENGFVQELSSADESYIPLFDLTGVRKAE